MQLDGSTADELVLTRGIDVCNIQPIVLQYTGLVD